MKDLIFFSGSGARIASHLGAADALERAGIDSRKYGGISGGAIIATFLRLGIIDAVRERVLLTTCADVFSPPIFDENGNFRPLLSLFGWLWHGPDAIATNNPLRRTLLGIDIARARWEKEQPDNVFTYVYEKGVGVEIRGSKGKGWDEWVEELVDSSSIPFLSTNEQYTDAGFLQQLPAWHFQTDKTLCFVTAQQQEEPHLFDEILRAIAIDNTTDENQGKAEIVFLPADNRTTQYREPLMRSSYTKSFRIVKKMYG